MEGIFSFLRRVRFFSRLPVGCTLWVSFSVFFASSVAHSEPLSFSDVIGSYARSVASIDNCRRFSQSIEPNEELGAEIISALGCSGVDYPTISVYETLFDTAYIEELENQFAETVADGGAFCRQIASQHASARVAFALTAISQISGACGC